MNTITGFIDELVILSDVLYEHLGEFGSWCQHMDIERNCVLMSTNECLVEFMLWYQLVQFVFQCQLMKVQGCMMLTWTCKNVIWQHVKCWHVRMWDVNMWNVDMWECEMLTCGMLTSENVRSWHVRVWECKTKFHSLYQLKSDLNQVNWIGQSWATQFMEGFEGRPSHFPLAKHIMCVSRRHTSYLVYQVSDFQWVVFTLPIVGKLSVVSWSAKIAHHEFSHNWEQLYSCVH